MMKRFGVLNFDKDSGRVTLADPTGVPLRALIDSAAAIAIDHFRQLLRWQDNKTAPRILAWQNISQDLRAAANLLRLWG